MDLNYRTNLLFPVPIHQFDVNGFSEIQDKLIDYAYDLKKRDEIDFVPLPKLFKELGTFIKFFGLDTRLRPLTLSRVDVLTATLYYTIK